MISDLKGKVVLVTGASTGIGAAVAKGFARHGAKVVVHYNASRDAAMAVLDEIKREGGDGLAVPGDVTKQEDVKALAARTMAHFGRIDVLINNAGGMLGRVVTTEMDDEHYDKVMRLNCWSVFSMTREVAPLMPSDGGSSIINVTSIAARNGGGGGAILYGASKGFVSAFTKGMARELVPSRIRVNAVAPGVIDTPFHERYSNAEQIEAMRRTVPMGRVGTSDDCVGAFLFLASGELSGYVTGQVLEVNGGQLMP
ncbi:SDR family NAD(P)-dependent oxidoreductase [Bosea vaviloviae]|uniref:Oxidoreductase n=1 Tax=Bosea vaviloviae TaxID=1526658 RepID=A0A1D7U9R2_9HYPH|nr:glucose 1-dehydrogenase [Bosea vaviloviae]AOO84034.1 oxidoreductase [Bosea vaviloviae]